MLSGPPSAFAVEFKVSVVDSRSLEKPIESHIRAICGCRHPKKAGPGRLLADAWHVGPRVSPRLLFGVALRGPQMCENPVVKGSSVGGRTWI